MDQSATNQFRAALAFLLKKEGRGSQTRLAQITKIDRGYLNGIVKGRKPGSEEKRGEISAHFEMNYEDMLSLGRRILNGEGDDTLLTKDSPEEELAEWGELTEDEKWNSESSNSLKSTKGVTNIPGRLVSTVEVLEAGGGYSDLLAGLIDAFQDSVSTRKKNLELEEALQDLINENSKLKDQLSEMKSRLASLEGGVSGDTKS